MKKSTNDVLNDFFIKNFSLITNKQSVYSALDQLLSEALKNGNYEIALHDTPKDSFILNINDNLFCIKKLKEDLGEEPNSSYYFKRHFEAWSKEWLLTLDSKNLHPTFIQLKVKTENSSLVIFNVAIKLIAGVDFVKDLSNSCEKKAIENQIGLLTQKTNKNKPL